MYTAIIILRGLYISITFYIVLYNYITTVIVIPTPGFVVKSRRLLGGKEKVFINILHHPQVSLEPPAAAPAGLSKEKVIQNHPLVSSIFSFKSYIFMFFFSLS